VEIPGHPGDREATGFGWPDPRAQQTMVAMKPRDRPAEATPDLRKYAWLAIVTAVLTVLLKGSAWAITGSVGLLSDAAESMVNLGFSRDTRKNAPWSSNSSFSATT
jgi:hypothetical protein